MGTIMKFVINMEVLDTELEQIEWLAFSQNVVVGVVLPRRKARERIEPRN